MKEHGDQYSDSLDTLDPRKVKALLAVLQQKEEKLQNQEEKIQSLQHQLDWFKRQLFGSTSEKKDFTDPPYQTTLADIFGDPSRSKPTQEEKQTITYERGKAKKKYLEGSPDGSQLRFDESVPVKEIDVSTPELEGENAEDYEVIGEHVVYRLAQRSASFVVLKYISQSVKHKSTNDIVSHSAQNAVFEKILADVSFLSGMLVDKFVYHLPLYRQHQRLENNGIVLARSTLTNLVKRTIELLKPIYQCQLDHILQSRVLAIDETPIKSGKGKKGKLKQGYFWPIMGEQDEICFTFSSSRGMGHLSAQLGDFNGTILSDGYKAYDLYSQSVSGCSVARCWVHCRRYFERAETSEPDACATALVYIGKLYHIEKEISQKKLQSEEKRQYRLEHSNPIVDQFFNWVHETQQNPELIPSNPLSKALCYARNQEQGLRQFVSDPNIPLDTNHVERAIRPIACGRRNWLFCWTEIGAEHVGIIQSLISSCRMHDVDPYVYLIDVLQRISSHPASKTHELTPRMWKTLFSDKPLESDLTKEAL